MTRTKRLAFALLAVSWVVLFVASARTSLGPASSEYAAVVNQAEDSVRDIARAGGEFSTGPEARARLEPLTNRPLAPLLSAWSALSVGRLGLLDGSSSVRLPWLILAGMVPLSLLLLLVERWGIEVALGAGLWLLVSPGFVAGALAVRASTLAVWSGWLVVCSCAWAARTREPRLRTALLVLCGALAALAFGLSFAAVWALPLLLVHGWCAHVSAAEREAARGRLPVPLPVLVALAALPAAVLTFDPLLWHTELPAMIRRVFDEEDAVQGVAPRMAPFVLPSLLALAALVHLARSALARRFATGEFRPPRDRSAIGLLLSLALLLAALRACSGDSSDAEFAVELLRLVLACLVAIGASTLASRLFARHARWVGAGLLVLTLLIR